MSAADSRWVSKEKEINRAGEISNRRRRTYDPARSIPQCRENVLHRELFWAWDACVVPSERMQLMRIRRSNKRFTELRGHFRGPAVQIEKSLVKMTELDRVKAIDLIDQSFANRAAQHIERMGRDGKHRQSAAGPKLAEVVEIF